MIYDLSKPPDLAKLILSMPKKFQAGAIRHYEKEHALDRDSNGDLCGDFMNEVKRIIEEES